MVRVGLAVSRLSQAIVVLIGVSLVVFLLVRVIPGDPVRLLVGDQATEEQVQQMRSKLGLDQPILKQYMVFIRDAVRGDFGVSIRQQRPVTGLVRQAFPATAKLAVSSILLAVLIGIPIGILSAARKGSTLDNLSMVLMLIGQAMPTFWWGILLIVVFSVTLRLLPTSGAGGIRHMILPTITLCTYYTAILARITRSAMLEVIGSDYIRTARAKGVGERRVVFAHALKNASIPIVTVVGLQFANLLSGAVITETVFAWPGMGLLTVNAIYTRDYPVIQATVLVLSGVFVLINTLVDISYLLLDPRIQGERL